MKNKVLIIDGNNLLHRVYWGATSVQNATETTHIYMFLKSLKSYVELFNPRKIIVCWDFREKTVENYRKMLDENYKAQRDEDKTQQVYQCVPIILKLLSSLGITQLNPMQLEADDIIFWLSTVKYPNDSIVVTTDTDMYQLISESLPDNIIYNPKKKREITPLFLREHFNVNNGFEFIIQKALRGDKADNLPGIKGIRTTKIQDILSILKINYDLDSLKDSSLLKPEELDQFKHNLKMMMFDMSLISEEELSWYEDNLHKPVESSKEEFSFLIKELEFWSIYKKVDFWFKTFNRIDFNDIFATLFDFSVDNS